MHGGLPYHIQKRACVCSSVCSSRPVARIFFFGGGGGCVVWRGRGIFARGFLLPLNQYITNSGMMIVFYYRPTQSRLDLNSPL